MRPFLFVLLTRILRRNMRPMQSQSDAQVVPLSSHLEVGRTYALCITNAQSNCVLEFQHLDKVAWHRYPGFSGTQTEGVVVEKFYAVSSTFRVRFDAVPSEEHSMSWISESSSDF